MHVGVELFDALGGAPANDDAATSLSVIAGATGIFGTGTAALGGCEKAEGVSRRLGGVYPSGPNFRPTGGRGKDTLMLMSANFRYRPMTPMGVTRGA